MNVLSLFSGIGGLDVAADAAGMTIIAHCEIDPFCRRVLAKHWPGVRCYDDIHAVSADRLRRDAIGPIDLICGGPPCQPASAAGKRAGAADSRWLWPEFLRVCRDVAPRWILAENPTGLISLRHPDGTPAFGGILGELSQMGYRVGWATYGADAVGAPQRRERVFLIGRLADTAVAHAGCAGQQRRGHVADTTGHGWQQRWAEPAREQGRPDAAERGSGDRKLGATDDGQPQPGVGGLPDGLPGGLDGRGLRWPARPGEQQHDWEPPRLATGVKQRVAKLRALGNAVVPAQAAPLFAAIIAAEHESGS